MTVLRRTRHDVASGPLRHRRSEAIATLVLALAGASIPFCLAGCSTGSDGASAEPAAHAPTMSLLPPPASDRIDYRDRTLVFYDLPGSGRWMVKRPDLPTAFPTGPEHTLPQGLDPEDTYVYYTRPGGQRSRAVTLAQIQAARPAHESAIR